MKKQIKIILKSIFLSLICLVLLTSIGINKAYASQQQPEQKPEIEQPEPPTFSVIYPDGTTEKAESYEDAEAKTKEWKLLYKATTDEKGQIVLPEWLTEGEILIKETVVPKGYIVTSTEKTVKLSDGEVVIENKKSFESPKPKEETPKPVSIPKTGIERILTPFKQQQQQQTTFIQDSVDITITGGDEKIREKKDFIIYKVDQDKKPLEGATFEVYGKPLIDVEVTVRIAKMFNDVMQQESQVQSLLPITGLLKFDFINKVSAETINQFEGQRYFDIKLKPGTYEISETIPANNLDDYNLGKYQSILVSYKFEVTEKGEISQIGDPVWKWVYVTYEDGNFFYADEEFNQHPETARQANVTIDKHIITINNVADRFVPPPQQCQEKGQQNSDQSPDANNGQDENMDPSGSNSDGCGI